MGLGLSVGYMADMKENDEEGYEDFITQMAKVNQALSAVGLPLHEEPESVKPEDAISLEMYGYSGLHYLRRIAAHLTYTEKLPPPGTEESTEAKFLKQYYKESVQGGRPRGLMSLFKRSASAKNFNFNHLIQHSDCEGYYLPIDFANVIFPDSKLKIPGEMIGSSYQLLKECKHLAKALDIPGSIAAESDELFEAPDNQGKGTGWQRYGVEAFSCVRLISACEASIRSGAAIVFA
jgi:hypothetical protein